MTKFLYAVATVAALFALNLTACSKSGGGGDSAPAAQCGAGYVYSTQYNSCLTQGNCPIGSAMLPQSNQQTNQQSNQQCVSINNGASNCVAGRVQTAQYGCLPQGTCPVNYGSFNGQCVVGYNNNNGYNNNGGYYNDGFNNNGYYWRNRNY